MLMPVIASAARQSKIIEIPVYSEDQVVLDCFDLLAMTRFSELP